MINVFSDEYGKQYAFGIGRVLLGKDHKHPRFYHGPKHTNCNFLAEVERVSTGEKDVNGHLVYKTKAINMAAFGKVAFLCRNFEKWDTFFFFGRYEVNQYLTEKNDTGEAVYVVNLDFVCPQITEDFFAASDAPQGDEPGSEYGSYEDFFYGGPNY